MIRIKPYQFVHFLQGAHFLSVLNSKLFDISIASEANAQNAECRVWLTLVVQANNRFSLVSPTTVFGH